jgi:serine-type D-Ala-D-Ala carboxypeptidase (penicillin-binding protein 5/6)
MQSMVFAVAMALIRLKMRSFLKSVAFIAALLCAALPATAQSLKTNLPIALLYDVKTGSFLYDKAIDEPFQPASLLKLLTAEAVFASLKSGKTTLETEYQITEQIWRKGGAPSRSAAMFAAVNSRVSVSNLLRGLIVISGNDAALALAHGIAGSEEAFVQLMQERAKSLGLNRTTIRNAMGFEHPEQKTTARDLMKVALAIINNYPEFFPLFSEREFTWNNIRQLNRNPLLSLNIGADGFMTGNISDDGFGLVATAQRGDRRLISVIMGAETALARASEARKILDWGNDNFSERKLLDRNAPLADARVSGGKEGVVPVGIEQDLTMLLPISTQDSFETIIRYKAPLTAPVVAGDVIGKLTVMNAGKLMIERPVIALQAVERGSLTKRAMDNVKTWFWGLFRRSEPAQRTPPRPTGAAKP